MPKLEFFLVCRSVQTDIITNETSFINVLEDITPEEFPYIIQRAMSVSLWNFEPSEARDDYQAALVVRIPGKREARFPMNLSFYEHRCRAIQGILEIPIEGPCDVTFEVQLNGKHAALHTVKIHPKEIRAAVEGGEPMPTSSPKRTKRLTKPK